MVVDKYVHNLKEKNKNKANQKFNKILYFKILTYQEEFFFKEDEIKSGS